MHMATSLHRCLRQVTIWMLAAACALLAPAVLAGDLQVSPISLEFSPTEQAQGLWLSNTGTATLRAQVRVQQWSQAGGEEILSATSELVASPPILQIPAGQSQLVRIIRLANDPPTRELSYRLLVDELPDETRDETSGLQLLLRYSIPVFVLPGGAPTIPPGQPVTATDVSTLTARLQADNGGMLQVDNRGQQRARISNLVYVNADGSRVELVPGLLGFVLAGQQLQWPLPLPGSAHAGGTLKAKFNNDAAEQTLSLQPPVR
jgi:fimbrial chaperone protein